MEEHDGIRSSRKMKSNSPCPNTSHLMTSRNESKVSAKRLEESREGSRATATNLAMLVRAGCVGADVMRVTIRRPTDTLNSNR